MIEISDKLLLLSASVKWKCLVIMIEELLSDVYGTWHYMDVCCYKKKQTTPSVPP